jgi:hypothetical protein
MLSEYFPFTISSLFLFKMSLKLSRQFNSYSIENYLVATRITNAVSLRCWPFLKTTHRHLRIRGAGAGCGFAA